MAWIRGLNEEDKKLIAMKEDEFDKFMCKSFPSIFQDRNKPMTKTCMCWGFNIGPGWRPWLLEACEKIDFLEQFSGSHFVSDQIKEKFGGLRFYYHLEKDKEDESLLDEKQEKIIESLIQDAVSIAEDKCSSYCETCGEMGSKTIDRRWTLTLCNDCARKAGRMTRNLKEEKEYEQKAKTKTANPDPVNADD